MKGSSITGRLVTPEPAVQDAQHPHRPQTGCCRFLSMSFAAIETRIVQSLCRHKNMTLHFEPNRLSEHCIDCGYQSPGWEVGKK